MTNKCKYEKLLNHDHGRKLTFFVKKVNMRLKQRACVG